jgi:paraquat-inducible protein B
VDHGLRAQLGVLGLATGLLFVELDFLDPAQFPAPVLAHPPKYVVVPSSLSAISEYQASLSEILSGLKKVDFAGISKDFKTLLATTNRKVEALDTKALGDKVGRAADAVTALVDSPEAKQAFANLNEAVAATRAVVARLDAQIGPVSEEMKATLTAAQTAMKTLDAAAATTKQFVQQQGQTGDELTVALRQIAEAAGALENLANAIERNPSSLIVGRKKPGKP